MMDRRSLLKRLGVAGLAIPAAALVEKALVLPEGARAAAAQPARSWDPHRFVLDGALYVRELKIEQDYDRRDVIGWDAPGLRRLAMNSTRRVTVTLEGNGDGVGVTMTENGIGEFTPVRIVRADRRYKFHAPLEVLDDVTIRRDEAGRIVKITDEDGTPWWRGGM